MDEFNNLIDTGRFLRVMADIETGRDEPEPHQQQRLVEFPKGHEYNGTSDECVFCGYSPWRHEWVKCTRSQEFKRDQHLTPAALFKAKVLAVLRDELDGDSPRWDGAISEVIRRVEAIAP